MLSAVDRKRDPGDISRLGKINHGGCNVVRLRPPLKRQALGLGGKLYVGLARAWQSRSWRHRVDKNPGRQCLRQRDRGRMQSSLTQGVGEKARSWLENTLVKNIHDRCIEAAGYLRGESLREE